MPSSGGCRLTHAKAQAVSRCFLARLPRPMSTRITWGLVNRQMLIRPTLGGAEIPRFSRALRRRVLLVSGPHFE